MRSERITGQDIGLSKSDCLRFALIGSFVLAACKDRVITANLSAADVRASAQALADDLKTALPSAAMKSPTPTEIPDPFESVVLPNGTGTLRKDGEHWIFNSPLEVEVGKNVPVQILEHTYEDGTRENWIAVLVEGSLWPLFIQNEKGSWEQSLFQYVDVKKPLIDAAGNPIPLTCEFGLNANFLSIDCFLVKSGVSFIGGLVEYTPAAISIGGNLNNLMYTGILIPQDQGWGPSLLEYAGRIYRTDFMGIRGIGNGFKFSQLEIGEVFFLDASYDRDNLEENLERVVSEGNQLAAAAYNRMLKYREATRNILSGVQLGKFSQDMFEHFEIASPYMVGIGK